MIAIRGLHHIYGTGDTRRHVLRALDLTVSRGEVVVLTGASGAGKTTLLTLCGALRSVQEGQLRVLGRDLRGLGAARQREIRGAIGFIFQVHHLIDALSAGQNVMMSLLGRVPVEDAATLAESALASLGLAAHINSLPEALSGGEKQRVAVARALIRKPALILADEPTASLDDASAAVVIEALSAAARQWASAALIVTHDPRLFAIATRRVHLTDGVLIEQPVHASRPRVLHAVAR